MSEMQPVVWWKMRCAEGDMYNDQRAKVGWLSGQMEKCGEFATGTWLHMAECVPAGGVSSEIL
jgi:hypothetical protein